MSAARLAQSVEHETLNLRVVGSSPTSGEQFFFQYNIQLYLRPRTNVTLVSILRCICVLLLSLQGDKLCAVCSGIQCLPHHL